MPPPKINLHKNSGKNLKNPQILLHI